MSLPIFEINQFAKKNNVGDFALAYGMSLQKIMSTLFKWTNLPDGLESWMIERLLFWRGEVGFWKLGNKYVITPVNKLDWDMYDLTTVANPIPWNGKGPSGGITLVSADAINPHKNGTVLTKAVFIRNNLNRTNTLFPVLGLLQFLQRTWNELNNDRKNSRSINIFSSTTKKAAKTLKKELNGVYFNDEPYIVVSDSASNTLKSATRLNPNNQPRSEALWNDFTKAKQEINELIGIPFDSRPDKQERVITQEINISQIQVNEILQSMLDFRKRAVKEINKVFNLNIRCEIDEIVEAAFNESTKETDKDTKINQDKKESKNEV